MLVHLLVIIGFWFPSSAADDQGFTELKRISDARSADDGQGRLMRLRTCRADAWIQCELCEEIRIVNASYAASRAPRRTGGCSYVNFTQEFDCLLPGISPYLQEIEGNCNGTQSCKSQSRIAVFDCGSLNETKSCCLEIFYTCEQRAGVTLSSLFVADNSSGYVTSVSLQCQSSDLSVESVVLAFNSSGEFHVGGICYRLSSNKKHVAKHCYRMGCSDVQVPGERGCGGNASIRNYGAYIYYTCGHNQQNQCQRLAETPTAQSSFPFNIPLYPAVGAIVTVSALVLLTSVGIVHIKRSRALASNRLARTQNTIGTEPPHGSQSPLEEDQYYSLIGTLPNSLQLKDVGEHVAKGPIYADCSISGDVAESGFQIERIQDKGESTKKFDSSRPTYSSDSIDSRDYLELVGDADDQGADKNVDPVYDEQKETRQSLEPGPYVSKKPNSDYDNSGICIKEPTSAYEPLDLIYLHPVYEKLNHSAVA